LLALLETRDNIMKRILIVGATSAIAEACARRWAKEPVSFALVGRNAAKLAQTAADLVVRGAQVHQEVLDMNDTGRFAAVLDRCMEACGGFDVALIAHGTLPDQAACEADALLAGREFSVNATSTIVFLTELAGRMETAGSGVIAVISSVAGDRGRASNHLYGAAKAAVSAFCEGLRGRLWRHGVHVLTIKPGFVDTPMTRGLPLPRPLVASPERVAAAIADAVARRRDTLYTPWFWALIMFVIRSIPARIFKRLKL
jgi:decaprenylphospho-beta-D-erythro-pentofuranosid-2-ulose 2-reductase